MRQGIGGACAHRLPFHRLKDANVWFRVHNLTPKLSGICLVHEDPGQSSHTGPFINLATRQHLLVFNSFPAHTLRWKEPRRELGAEPALADIAS